MIISASRRTDIPACYPLWFMNRVREGYVHVRNPVNPRQVSRINLSPEYTDCIVFWTKNAAPMLKYLDELSAYDYYFQFTVTGYGKDVEPGIPDKKKVVILAFRELAEKIGPQRVIWRYDPILFTRRYTPEYHLRTFEYIAEALRGYTEKCVISFVDVYAGNRKKLEKLKLTGIAEDALKEFARGLAAVARAKGMRTASCAEKIDLRECGIEHNCCIDGKLIEEITGVPLNVRKDKSQRPECGCAESADIGRYGTCVNGCLYCYAGRGGSGGYDPRSSLLCDVIKEEDHVTERRAKPSADPQTCMKF